jgi:hypothetical protein
MTCMDSVENFERSLTDHTGPLDRRMKGNTKDRHALHARTWIK